MMDALLVNAPVRDPWIDAHARAGPPLGLASIGAVLQADGLEVFALDLNLARSSPEEELFGALSEKNPWMVAFSSTTETYPQGIRLARFVKDIDKNLLTVMGGPHVTFLSEDALATGAVDAVVRGEGEEAIRDLAHAYRLGNGSLEEIAGISFRSNGSFRSNPNRLPVADLDALPMPARELFPLENYQYPGNLITARGCPAACIFCAASALSGGTYRVRSAERVVEEMTHLAIDHGLKHCTIVDDTFTVDMARTVRICELLEGLGKPLKWGCSTRVSSVNPELLGKMHRAGCHEIQFGVESGSDVILASLRKGIALRQVYQAVRWAQDAGIRVTCSFMFPHPEDSHATIKETRTVMREMAKRSVKISLAVTTPYPGTAIWERAAEYGIEIQSTDWNDYDACTPVFSTRTLSRKEISLLIIDLLYNGP